MSERNLNKQFVKDKIYVMFQRVNKTIHHFIDNLTEIYKEYGINYPISQLQPIITRILTPYQLLTEYGIADNSKLVSNSQFLSQFSARPQTVSIMENLHNRVPQKQKTFKFPTFNSTAHTQSSENIQNSMINFHQNYRKFPNESYIRRGGRPRALTNDMEKQLARWIVDQVSKGQQITRKVVTKLACQLLNDPQFQGSDGWYSNFVKRNPEIKRLVLRSRKSSSINENERVHKNIHYYPIQNKSIRLEKPKYYFPKQKLRDQLDQDSQNFQHSNLYLQQQDNKEQQQNQGSQIQNQSESQNSKQKQAERQQRSQQQSQNQSRQQNQNDSSEENVRKQQNI